MSDDSSRIVGDLTFYPDAQWPPKDAGVEKGYLVLRTPDGDEAEVADMALLHDGDGSAVGLIDHSTWRRGVVRDEEQ